MVLSGRRWQLCNNNQYYLRGINPIAIVLMAIVIAPTILQSTIATATTNLPHSNITDGDNNNEYNNSFTVVPSNQSSALLDKLMLLLEDCLLTSVIPEDGFNYCSQLLMNSIHVIQT